MEARSESERRIENPSHSTIQKQSWIVLVMVGLYSAGMLYIWFSVPLTDYQAVAIAGFGCGLQGTLITMLKLLGG